MTDSSSRLVASSKLPITILIAVKNESLNLPKCLEALTPAERVVLVDSDSTDETAQIAQDYGVEIVQFKYSYTYPKKRQWALDSVSINTPWIFLLDADEVMTDELWGEISFVLNSPNPKAAYLVEKAFHFLGRRFRFGGFSFQAVLLLQTGKGRFEELAVDPCSNLDMEVHERIVVDGEIGALKNPVLHEDFKGLQAYIDRHNKYSSWEAELRLRYLDSGQYGDSAVKPKLLGNSQERRRFLKKLVLRIPLEHWIWFGYHYFIRLGFLEGRRGLIACQIRASYIAQTNAKIYEARLKQKHRIS
jgi:glycosyltransferase involved in cell wall biosynthesis